MTETLSTSRYEPEYLKNTSMNMLPEADSVLSSESPALSFRIIREAEDDDSDIEEDCAYVLFKREIVTKQINQTPHKEESATNLQRFPSVFGNDEPSTQSQESSKENDQKQLPKEDNSNLGAVKKPRKTWGSQIINGLTKVFKKSKSL